MKKALLSFSLFMACLLAFSPMQAENKINPKLTYLLPPDIADCWEGLPGMLGIAVGTPRIYAIVEDDGKVYIGGRFESVDGVAANNIAVWDGTSWSAVGGGTDGTVEALAVKDGNVYAGGFFNMAGETAVRNLAVWDGTSWSDVGGGVNSVVTAIAFQGNDLIVGGVFTEVGPSNLSAWRIARYDGTTWAEIGGGAYYLEPEGDVGGNVETIEVVGTDIYIGGRINNVNGRVDFPTVTGERVGQVAKWDGTNWDDLDGGVNQPEAGFIDAASIDALEWDGTYLYAGGNFTEAGGGTMFDGIPGTAALNLARWDGTQWENIGDVGTEVFHPDNSRVRALEKTGNTLYVGGDFAMAGGIAAQNIASLDDMGWNNIGDVNDRINAMDLSCNLYAGGEFTMVEGESAASSAIYSCVAQDPLAISFTTSMYGSFEVSCNGENDGSIDITVEGGCAPYTYSWSNGAMTEDLSGLSAGTYDIAVTDENGSIVMETIILAEPEALVISAGADQTVYLGYDPAECTTLTASMPDGGVPPYTIMWSTGETTTDIEVCPIITTNYSLTVTDANGCMSTDDVTVFVEDIRNPDNPNILAICHKPGASNENTIYVNSNAVANHLAHGDQLGSCAGDDATESGDQAYEKGELSKKQKTKADKEHKQQIKTYPNPFNHSARLQFSLPYADQVSLKVYDLKGNEIETLFEGQVQPDKQYEVEFSPANKLNNGMYFYHLVGNNGTIERGKMILVR